MKVVVNVTSQRERSGQKYQSNDLLGGDFWILNVQRPLQYQSATFEVFGTDAK